MNYYLNRFAVREKLIEVKAPMDLGLIVVIPCCNEPNLIASLNSLYRCISPKSAVEIIVVINASEIANNDIIDQNQKTYQEAIDWIQLQEKNWINTHVILENSLPKKHAGVGLARKIGMDEAVRRFQELNNDDGIIVCFDADAKCEKNYFQAIEQHFMERVKSPACSIHFEHPIEGDEYSGAIYSGIIGYELHLRYYKNALQYCKLPYAFHTIGSSMAVRNWAYQKQNGMNKRKAGEDFYFLQKLIVLGDFSELTSTKVIPSPRVSDRVPFGTGRAMQEILAAENEIVKTYSFESFKDLKSFTALVPRLYQNTPKLPKSVEQFLNTVDYSENLVKIRKNSTSVAHFEKLFYGWFNAFKVLKYVHYARDNFYQDVAINKAASELMSELGGSMMVDDKSLLKAYRKIDTDLH